jgi:hypothetical protein
MDALDPVALSAPATAITAGGAHTCALLTGGDVKCWGGGLDGRLGQDSTDTIGDAPGDMAALDAVALGAPATAVSAGFQQTCALLDDATVECWGSGGLGQDAFLEIGDQPGEMATLEAIDFGGGRTATAVTTGILYSCALLDDATLRCWGNGNDGQLGQDSTADVDGSPRDLDPIGLGRPVGVGAQEQPDAHLRRGTGAFTGLDTYNTSGAGQGRSTTVAARGTARFTVRIENDGTYTDSFRVKGAGSTTRYTVTYRRGNNNITTAVRGAGFVTPEIRAGQRLDLTVTIQAKANARRGQRIDRLVTITSQDDTTRTDAVRARVTRR